MDLSPKELVVVPQNTGAVPCARIVVFDHTVLLDAKSYLLL